MLLRCLLLAVALLSLDIAPAWAHAVLVAQDPPDGATVGTAPAAVTLRFNEVVTPVFVRVMNAQGAPVALPEAPRAADGAVTVRLPADLPAGRYVVSWRVVSGDSHPIGGASVFGLGVAVTAHAAGAAPAEEEGPWLALKILLRWLQDVALLLVTGSALYAVLVVRREESAATAWMVAGALVAVSASIGAQGALMAQAPPAALLTAAPWELGARSTVGLGALIMIAGLSLMIAGQLLRPSRRAAALTALGAMGALASLAASGHGATAAPRWLAQPVLVLHVVCAAFWLGSLWPLLMLLRQEARTRPGTHRVLRRFSAIAVPAVLLLACAGVTVAVTRIAALDDLVATSYGLLLIGKGAGFSLLLALAALNRMALVPRLGLAERGAATWLRRTIAAELAIGIAVLAITAVLAHTPPPLRGPDEGSAAAVTLVAVGDRRILTMTIDPGRPGPNRITLALADADQQPIDAIEVVLWASLPERGVEEVRRPAARTGLGRFALEADILSIPGRWTLRVDALVTDFEKAVFEIALPLPWPR